jgi:hypothetical protein
MERLENRGMIRYSVVELISGEVIRANVGADEAYRVRDQHQKDMLRAGRDLRRKRYAVRPTDTAHPVQVGFRA